MSGKYNQGKSKVYNEFLRVDRDDDKKSNKLLNELYNIDNKNFKGVRFIKCGNDVIASIFNKHIFHLYDCEIKE